GILDRSMLSQFAKPTLAGAVMAVVGLSVARGNAVIGAALSVGAYLLVLWVCGEFRGAHLRTLLLTLRRRPA
ncbi:MAG TPA: hypothetical protein VGV09_20135, partial [Steroidobacteraceae bacterium]|nr:hypothetical protein [Steroidobacteraceae bacterium]